MHISSPKHDHFEFNSGRYLFLFEFIHRIRISYWCCFPFYISPSNWFHLCSSSSFAYFIYTYIFSLSLVIRILQFYWVFIILHDEKTAFFTRFFLFGVICWIFFYMRIRIKCLSSAWMWKNKRVGLIVLPRPKNNKDARDHHWKQLTNLKQMSKYIQPQIDR